MIVAKNLTIQNFMWVNITDEFDLFDFIFSVKGEVDIKPSETTLSQLDISIEETKTPEKLFDDLGPYFCLSLTREQILQIRFSHPKELSLKNYIYQLKSDWVKKIKIPPLGNQQELALFRKLKDFLIKDEEKSIKWLKDGGCLSELLFQTPKICLEAIKLSPSSLSVVRIASEELYLTTLFNQRSGEINFPKQTKEIKTLFLMLKNTPFSSYRQIRYQLANGIIDLPESHYHVLEQLYGY